MMPCLLCSVEFWSINVKKPILALTELPISNNAIQFHHVQLHLNKLTLGILWEGAVCELGVM